MSIKIKAYRRHDQAAVYLDVVTEDGQVIGFGSETTHLVYEVLLRMECNVAIRMLEAETPLGKEQ